MAVEERRGCGCSKARWPALAGIAILLLVVATGCSIPPPREEVRSIQTMEAIFTTVWYNSDTTSETAGSVSLGLRWITEIDIAHGLPRLHVGIPYQIEVTQYGYTFPNDRVITAAKEIDDGN